MNWHILLPAIIVLVMILTWLGASRFQALAPLRRQLRLMMMILAVSLVILALNTPPVSRLADFSKPLRLIWLIELLLIMVLTIRLIRHIVFDWLISRRAMERQLKVVEDVVGIVLYIIGILLIADNYLKIQITPLLATSAVITIVAGFALQNILGDLFAGLALNFDESLHIGDWIQIGAIEGRIEQLRWRSMKIRNREGFLVLVPNQSASKETVTVLGGSGAQTSVRLSIGVSYDNPPDQVMALIRQKITQIDVVIPEAPVQVWISSFEDFAITYTIRFQIKDPAQKDQVAGQLRHHLWYAFKRRGFVIPYPIRTLITAPEKHPVDEKSRIMAILEQNEILTKLPPDRLDQLTCVSERLLFGRGEQIIRENEEGRAFHIILSGQVEVTHKGNRVATLSSGQYFGEMALFTGERTSADVVALEECTILRIGAGDFKALIAMNDQTAQAISEVIARRRALNLEEDAEQCRNRAKGLGRESASIFQRIKRYFEMSD
jgi:small-conductance mechanosensitive channel/CRP-like cAMP-binding protein